MSKSKNISINRSQFSSAMRLPSTDQQLNINQASDRYNHPTYLEYLKRGNLLRGCKEMGVITASDVVPQPKTWVYPDWLPRGELSLLIGAPNTGKTAFECALAAGVTRGPSYSLPCGLTPAGLGRVIIVNREDDIATSLVPRLQAAGGDLSKVHFIGCKGSGDEESSFSFSNARDLAFLEDLAKLWEDPVVLIIVDPIYFAVDGDHNNNHKAREAYEGLAKLAKRLRCAILGIAHTVRNPRNKSPLDRVAGAPALREVPRAVMMLSKIASGPTATGGTHVLVHAKNNDGKLDGGLEICTAPVDISGSDNPIVTTRIVVTAQLTGSAEEILHDADGGKPSKTLLKSEAAEKLLRQVLADGPRPRIEIEKLAEEIGVSLGTLLNAKTSLNIVTKKREGDGRSVWRLPDSYTGDNSLDESGGGDKENKNMRCCSLGGHFYRS